MGNDSHFELLTKNKYPLPLVRSALQKCVRYGLEVDAGYWLAELVESGYVNYALTTLGTVCVEDCMADKTTVAAVMSVLDFYKNIYREKKLKAEYRPALATVLIWLCRARHSRCGDDFWCYVEERRKAGWHLEIPDFAKDEHVPDAYKTADERKRGWRFWVRVASRLKNEATAQEIGGPTYSEVMQRYFLRGKPGNEDESDYKPLDPSKPYEPIVSKPFLLDEEEKDV